jgi:hypothetical protein
MQVRGQMSSQLRYERLASFGLATFLSQLSVTSSVSFFLTLFLRFLVESFEFLIYLRSMSSFDASSK